MCVFVRQKNTALIVQGSYQNILNILSHTYKYREDIMFQVHAYTYICSCAHIYKIHITSVHLYAYSKEWTCCIHFAIIITKFAPFPIFLKQKSTMIMRIFIKNTITYRVLVIRYNDCKNTTSPYQSIWSTINLSLQGIFHTTIYLASIIALSIPITQRSPRVDQVKFYADVMVVLGETLK